MVEIFSEMNVVWGPKSWEPSGRFVAVTATVFDKLRLMGVQNLILLRPG